MSTHDSAGSHGKQAEDRINFPKVIAVGLVSLVIFALATWWAIAILHSERAEMKNRSEGRMTAEIGKAEIGIVDQVPFNDDKRLDRWRRERAEWLHGYGWVDRQHNLIRIPIELAIDEVLAGAVPPPVSPALSPAPAPPPPPPHPGGAR